MYHCTEVVIIITCIVTLYWSCYYYTCIITLYWSHYYTRIITLYWNGVHHDTVVTEDVSETCHMCVTLQSHRFFVLYKWEKKNIFIVSSFFQFFIKQQVHWIYVWTWMSLYVCMYVLWFWVSVWCKRGWCLHYCVSFLLCTDLNMHSFF